MRRYYEENHKPNIASAFVNTIWNTDTTNLFGFISEKLFVLAMWYYTIDIHNNSED